LRVDGSGGETPGMPTTGEAHMLGRDGELEVLTGLARDAASTARRNAAARRSA